MTTANQPPVEEQEKLLGQQYHTTIPPLLRMYFLPLYGLLITYTMFVWVNAFWFDSANVKTLSVMELSRAGLRYNKAERNKIREVLKGQSTKKNQTAEKRRLTLLKQKANSFREVARWLWTEPQKKSGSFHVRQGQVLMTRELWKVLQTRCDGKQSKQCTGNMKWTEKERDFLFTLLNPYKATFGSSLRELGPLNPLKAYEKIFNVYGIRSEVKAGKGSKVELSSENDPIYHMIFHIQERLRNSFAYQRAINFNGWIQFWTFWFFWTAILALLIRIRFYTAAPFIGREFAAWKEMATLQAGESASSLKQHLSPDKDDGFLVRQSFQPLMYLEGVGVTLEERREEARVGVEIVGTLQERMEVSYSGIRYLAWAIPSIGFVGTVLGISKSMLQADKIVLETGARQSVVLKAITNDLGVAFDTTLIALLLSILLMMVIHLVQALEDRLFCDIKENLYRVAEGVPEADL